MLIKVYSAYLFTLHLEDSWSKVVEDKQLFFAINCLEGASNILLLYFRIKAFSIVVDIG